jgi:hypothetical protein
MITAGFKAAWSIPAARQSSITRACLEQLLLARDVQVGLDRARNRAAQLIVIG